MHGVPIVCLFFVLPIAYCLLSDDNRRLMELVMEVAFYNCVCRVLVPCGVELEAGVKKN